MTFNTRTVAYDNGSLPFGGTQADTPIFAVDDSFLDPQDTSPQGVDDLSWSDKLAFTIDDVLTPSECARLISLTEQLGFQDAAPGIQTPPGMRQNTTVHWIASAPDMERIYQRIAHLLPTTIEGRRLHNTLSHRFNTYRYHDGQQFRPHIDGDWPGYGLDDSGRSMATWRDSYSMMSMLIYLNGQREGIQGGDTLLFEGQHVRHRVTPKAGRALFFRHGLHTQSVLHAGAVVEGDQPKYVARVNVLYALP